MDTRSGYIFRIEPAYKLDDVEIIAREHPDTFGIPSIEMRERLRVGELAKVHFRGMDDEGEEVVERMWVEVTEIDQHGYVGRLDNDPKRLVGVVSDEAVLFQPRNISSIYVEEGHDWEERVNLPGHSFE